MAARKIFITTSIITISLILVIYPFWPPIFWSFLVIIPLLFVGINDIRQKKHTIQNNFPIIGHFRYLLEKFRPEIMQYFIENDTEGKPISRLNRSLIYQRAKNTTDTTPFGTKSDVYEVGYECMAHSIYPKKLTELPVNPTVLIGGKDCKQPYLASILNVSAMSYGALSKNAILALNKGAKIGSFAHNTGEGGLSPYHLENGGDLIWQIGTGYFSCRTESGDFCPVTFKEKVAISAIKMIEIKLSQGAKPGHGGILPAVKNTLEISKIRGVKPFVAVHSPPYHTAFSDAEGLMRFIKQLRELSDGKPIGFKLCIGQKEEFITLCEAMVKWQIIPDFISIDGGEGGTGAAPVEFSDSMGLPLKDSLAFVSNTLKKYNLRNDIKIIAAGKILTAFHIATVLALGADLCNSARAMMMALGCIQALECNTNTCPVGVATQDKDLMKGLDVADKSVRVANFHKNTVHSFLELLAAAGLSKPEELQRKHILYRKGPNDLVSYNDIYPENR